MPCVEDANSELLDIEGGWVDGAVAACPMTTTGCKIQWQVFIEMRHRAEFWADFPASDNARIDASYVTDKLPVEFASPGEDNSWTVDLNSMVQTNRDSGTDRRIRRTVIVAPKLTTG
jgi:hypothetical protein